MGKPSDVPAYAVAPAPPGGLHVWVRKDGRAAERHSLDDRACFWIGRNEDICTFLGVQDKSISRLHAQLVHNGKVRSGAASSASRAGCRAPPLWRTPNGGGSGCRGRGSASLRAGRAHPARLGSLFRCVR